MRPGSATRRILMTITSISVYQMACHSEECADMAGEAGFLKNTIVESVRGRTAAIRFRTVDNDE